MPDGTSSRIQGSNPPQPSCRIAWAYGIQKLGVGDEVAAVEVAGVLDDVSLGLTASDNEVITGVLNTTVEELVEEAMELPLNMPNEEDDIDELAEEADELELVALTNEDDFDDVKVMNVDDFEEVEEAEEVFEVDIKVDDLVDEIVPFVDVNVVQGFLVELLDVFVAILVEVVVFVELFDEELEDEVFREVKALDDAVGWARIVSKATAAIKARAQGSFSFPSTDGQEPRNLILVIERADSADWKCHNDRYIYSSTTAFI